MKYTEDELVTPVIVEITPRKEKKERNASLIARILRRIGL
jgi:hypothetical protein